MVDPDSAPPLPPAAERELVILDLREASAPALAAALGLPEYEAGQRVTRGGYQLHRIAEPGSARAEAERLRAAGLAVRQVAEADARAAGQPCLVLGGAREGQALALRTAEGARRVDPDEVLLVVAGPIARAREAPAQWKRVPMAGPSEGYRFHLHLRHQIAPLEIDPDDFESAGDARAPALALLRAWLRETGPVLDEGFRFLAPALSPALPAAATAASAAEALPSSRPGKAPLRFDNVAQFRFYSGWRAALQRTPA